MRMLFVSATPFNVYGGSGTFVGITTLMDALRKMGVTVDVLSPAIRLPIFTFERLLFNATLRFSERDSYDVVVGFDMDACWMPKRPGQLHVASIKGVIADEMRFESGWTKASMRLQAGCEGHHVRRADLVVTTSAYAAARIRSLYHLPRDPLIVPEPIDLAAWREGLERAPAITRTGKFVVLSVGRFYPRKRLDVLLRAATMLRSRIPHLEVRIVGGGPEEGRLRRICRELNLDDVVVWRINIGREELLSEYSHCDVFCLPSVQEGFGIVFLEAMASGKPIVAANAGAAREVARHGVLVKPDSVEDVALLLHLLYVNNALRDQRGLAGRQFVEQFDAPRVAESFLEAIRSAQPSHPVS